MADKRQDSELKVTDRRLFTADGELRTTLDEEKESQDRPKQDRPEQDRPQHARVEPAPPPAAEPSPPSPIQSTTPAGAAPPESDLPVPPTPTEQQAQHDAYKESSRDLDRRVELSGHSAKELEITFERFMASLYMSAMMQLGLMQEQGGQPGVDLLGARQTIDTLGMIAEKTKGNLTPKEQAFLQNCLYELRMAYVEVTNAIARAPQTPGPITGTNG
ncbi:MAG: DUF1844 domain-containing protein [Terriglobales bacterium]|jgi:hypothetical protein